MVGLVRLVRLVGLVKTLQFTVDVIHVATRWLDG